MFGLRVGGWELQYQAIEVIHSEQIENAPESTPMFDMETVFERSSNFTCKYTQIRLTCANYLCSESGSASIFDFRRTVDKMSQKAPHWRIWWHKLDAHRSKLYQPLVPVPLQSKTTMSNPQGVSNKSLDTGRGYHKIATGAALTTVKEHESERDLTLFGANFCPFVQRVWVAFEFLKLPYQVSAWVVMYDGRIMNNFISTVGLAVLSFLREYLSVYLQTKLIRTKSPKVFWNFLQRVSYQP